MSSILYCGWVGRGNLGDDYMWDIFRALCRIYDPKNKIKVEATFPGTDLNMVHKRYDLIVLGGGSVIDEFYIDFVYRAMNLGIPVVVWGSGIDRIGIKKLELILNGNDSPIKPPLSNNLQAKLKKIIPYTKSFSVRGPLTHSIIKRLTSDTGKIKVSGDPGILINDNELFSNRKLKSKRSPTISPPCIAVNWGTSYNNIYGGSETMVRKELASALRKLCDNGYHLLLYNVWKADIRSLHELKREINRPSHIKLWLNPTVDELLSTLPSCDYSINFKLHANILSLAAGVPCMALGYRFKVYDFFYSIGLPQLVLPPHSDDFRKEVLHLHHYIQSNRSLVLSTYSSFEKNYKERLVAEFKSIIDIASAT